MDLGLKISASVHGLLILGTIFGGALFNAEDREAEPITTVTLLSQGEFAALTEAAPPPELEETQAEPEEAEAQPTPLPEGIPEEGVASDQDQAGELRADEPTPDVTPEAADVISNEVNVQEDPIAQEAAVDQEATEDTEGEPTPEPEQEATERESTTTEIVTEAEEANISGAPVKTSIPRARPKSITEPDDVVVAEPEPEEAPTPETPSIDDLIADSVEDVLQEEFGNSDQGDPSPVPLSPVEASNLIFNVQRCWSFPVGVENAAELEVVLEFDMSPQGDVTGLPRLVEPASATGRVQQAVDAAQRAVLDCQPYALPVDKYESWKTVRIRFDPQNMVNR